MKGKFVKRLTAVVLLMTLLGSDLMAQSNYREWWNSLPAAWKTIFRDQELKGKQVDPTDEELSTFNNITNINCAGNKDIESLKPLAFLQRLEYIDCSNTNIRSLEGIEDLKNVRVLNCSNNDNINSLQPCAGLQNLSELNCGNTMVKSLMPLRNLTSLQKLDIHFCTVNSLTMIGDLKNLRELNVSQNQSLFSIAGIERLPQLVSFDCSETNVNDLAPLQNNKTLEYLNIADTKVQTLRPLQQIHTLKEVDCSGTRIAIASLDYFYSHLRLQFLRGKNLSIEQKQLDDFTTTFTKKNVNCDVILISK